MGQVAMESIKCAVTEENKVIIKRTLNKELDLPDDFQWSENVLDFDLGMHGIRVTLDVLPDSRGYLVSARYGEKNGCIVGLLIVTSIVWFILLKGEADITAVLFGSIILACLSGGLLSLVNYWRVKLKLKNAFKKVSQILN